MKFKAPSITLLANYFELFFAEVREEHSGAYVTSALAEKSRKKHLRKMKLKGVVAVFFGELF